MQFGKNDAYIYIHMCVCVIILFLIDEMIIWFMAWRLKTTNERWLVIWEIKIVNADKRTFDKSEIFERVYVSNYIYDKRNMDLSGETIVIYTAPKSIPVSLEVQGVSWTFGLNYIDSYRQGRTPPSILYKLVFTCYLCTV